MDVMQLATLGGEPSRVAAGSDWLAWSSFTISSFGFVGTVLAAFYWWKESRKAKTTVGRRANKDLALLFLAGGLSCFGMRCLMTFVPFWSLHLLALAATAIGVWKVVYEIRNSTVQFTPNDEAIAQASAMVNESVEMLEKVISTERRKPNQDKAKELLNRLRKMQSDLAAGQPVTSEEPPHDSPVC